MKQKLLLYGVSSHFGGVETFIFNLIEYLNKDFFDISLLVNTDDYVGKEFLSKHQIQIIKGPNRRENPLSYKNKLKKILEDHRFDIVWSNLTSLSDINLIKAAKELGIEKRIVYSHQSKNMGGKLTGILHQLNKKIYLKNNATHFWACSKQAWDYFYKGIIEFNINDVFMNAVDPQRFEFNENIRASKRTELGLSNSFVIGTVGRLTQEKNHTFLIDVVSDLVEKNYDVKCLIVGSGHKKAEIQNKIQNLGLEKNVILLGQRNDVAELLNVFDCFVLPSLFEGLPFVLVEAQMNGLSIVSSDQVSEQSKFTVNFEFIPLDVEQWSKSIQLIIKSFKRDKANNYEIVNSEFNVFNQIDEFEKRLK